ncbi:MAG: hypothetical protein IJ308_04300 [Clostridia bacterium]|nr:hypothetical protein [Clostridia bacterium]
MKAEKLKIGDKVIMNDRYRVSEKTKARYLLLETSHLKFAERNASF